MALYSSPFHSGGVIILSCEMGEGKEHKSSQLSRGTESRADSERHSEVLDFWWDVVTA